MADAFIERKLKTYFSRIDFDKDGAITRSDFEGLGTRFVESEKLDAAKGADLKAKLVQVWEQYLKGVVSDGTKLTESVFVEAVKKQRGDPKFKEVLAGPLPLFFSAVDGNGDGLIQKEEFQLFFKLLGIEKDAAKSFEAIDTNKDGDISKEEFVIAGTDFFTSTDESSPSKLFWGPLV
jgi:Ca2+-binding EF-hand superfamily protein